MNISSCPDLRNAVIIYLQRPIISIISVIKEGAKLELTICDMYQTVAIKDEYTGERDYSLDYDILQSDDYSEEVSTIDG